MRPSSSKPTSYQYANAWRLPVERMSSSRSRRSLTARPVLRATIAATHANSDICVSLPPKPPPMRRHSTTTSCAAMPERVRDHVLHLARMLRRRVDVHAAVLARDRQRDLAFEVEVVLAAGAHGAAQAMRRRAPARAAASPRVTCTGGSTYDCAGERVVDGEDRGQRLEVELARACAARRAVLHVGRPRPRTPAGPRTRRVLVREDRIVVLDRADVVDARNVGGGDHGDHARRGAHRGEVDAAQPCRARSGSRRAPRAACRAARAGRRCRAPRR